MEFSVLKKSLNDGNVKPMYVLTGDDEYLKNAAVNLVKGKISMPEFNFISLESPTSEEVKDALEAMPIMSDFRLVKVDKLSEAKALADYMDNPNPSSVLIITHADIEDKKEKSKPKAAGAKASAKKSDKNILKDFLSSGEIVSCKPLNNHIIEVWLNAEAEKYGIKIERSASNLLIEYCRNYMMRISSEFQKLAAFCTDGTIRADDVRELVKPDVEYAVWEFSNAIAHGDMNAAVKVYNSFESSYQSPEMLFGLVYSHFRKMYYSLVCNDEEELLKSLKMTEKAVFMNRKEAQKFGKVKLRRLLKTLADMDAGFKSSSIVRDITAELIISRVIDEVLS